MKKLEKSVPIIRFKGFYEAWEQRKFIEIINRLSKTSNSSILPKVEYEDIIAEEGRLNKDISNKFDSRKGILFQPKNILYGKLRPYLKNWLYPDFKGVAVGDFWVFEAIEATPRFIYNLIQSDSYQKVANDTAGTKMPRSDWTKVSNSSFFIPKESSEQKRIGTFFKQLDDTIVLHQRKLDALKLMKKGLLQQMFPNNEEKVPRLRFADFNEKWERCKISSFARNTYGGGTPKTNVPEYWQGRIPWIQSGDLLIDSLFNIIPKKHVTGSAVKSSATKCIPANSIAIVTRVGVGKLAFIPFEYTTSQDFLSLSNLRVDSNFGTYSIYIMLQRELNNIQGSTIKGITKSDLLEKNINKPLNRIEQERIGVSLKLLDNIITLHQSKLEKLSSLKKVYLQRMFI